MNEERTYRIYMTDALRAAYKLNMRFADVIEDEKKPPKKEESGTEIINRITEKIRKLS